MESNNYHFTEKNLRFFYDTADFEFLKPIESNFEIIKSELLELLEMQKENQWLRTFPNYVTSEKDKAWKVFSFVFFGIKFLHNAELCPKTSELIYSIPDIISCDYSFLKGNSHILPHKGYSRMVLRCHLPLIVPSSKDCAIRVGDKTHHWQEGKLVIFDDSFEHEAWNNSKDDRVVLMFDIPNPNWEYSAEQISEFKIRNMDDPFLLSMANKEEWLEFYRQKSIPKMNFE